MSRKNVRKSVDTFANMMEFKLQLNDWKKPWSTSNPWNLLSLLEEEIEELKDSMRENITNGHINVCYECADVANFAMMISDLYSKMIGKGAGDSDD
jgi:NTP pyrophosphatase (non-canonical NTP hydrolase)